MTFTPQQLDMTPPGSILDWRIFDDGFTADDYRVIHLAPKHWLVLRGDSIVGTYRRLKTAFVSAEQHHRRALRLDRIKATAVTVVSVVLAWVVLLEVLSWTAPGLWLLFPITLFGMSSVFKLVARIAGNPRTAYFGPTPVAVRDMDGNHRFLRRRFYRA